MITYTTQETISHVLTQEGASIALNGSYEARVWAVLPAKGEAEPIPPKDLEKRVGTETAKLGQANAFKKKWITKDGAGLVRIVCEAIYILLGNPSNVKSNVCRFQRLLTKHNWTCVRLTRRVR